jgi:hypothetical protein
VGIRSYLRGDDILAESRTLSPPISDARGPWIPALADDPELPVYTRTSPLGRITPSNFGYYSASGTPPQARVTAAPDHEQERGLAALLLDECECGVGKNRAPAFSKCTLAYRRDAFDVGS